MPSVSAIRRSRVSADSSPGMRAVSSILNSSPHSVSLRRHLGYADGPGGIGRGLRFPALRSRRARRGHGVTRLAGRNRFHGDADRLGSGAGEQPIQPAARHGRGVDRRCRSILGALGALFGRGEEFEWEAIPGDPDGRVVFGLGAVRRPLLDSRRDIGAHPHLAPQLGALAVLDIAGGGAGSRAGRALFGIFVVDRDLGRTQLALQVRRALLDGVELGARLIGQRLGRGQFGHALALFGLAFAKLAKAFDGLSHGWEASRSLRRPSRPGWPLLAAFGEGK